MSALATEFAASASTLANCPRWHRSEAAIAGRSNVGKSSLLNALAGEKGLARTGKTPGRTRLLNFYTIGNLLALCDLPGYGYAKLPHEEARRIAAMMRAYLERRRHLVALAILIDARRGPEAEELDLIALAERRCVDAIVIATKCDKLRNSERAAAIARFTSAGLTPVLCSAASGEGIEELRRRFLALARSGQDRAAEAE